MTTAHPADPVETAASPTPVELVEVGPRDGLQNEARTLPVATRVELVHRLVDLGLRRLEVASFVRPDLVPQMAGAEELLGALEPREDTTYVGLVLNRRGAERAVLTAVDELNMVVPVTDTFARRNQGSDTAGLVEQAAGAVQVAHDAGLRCSVTLPVSFGCPFEGEVSVRRVADVVDRVLDLGVDEIAVADTIGVGVPSQVAALGALLVGDPRATRVRFHFHNTRNTGYANAWAAATLPLGAGRRLALDASIGGFGGCPFAPAATGNLATEDLAYLLRRGGVAVVGPAERDLTRDLELDLEQAASVARWLGSELGSPVQGLLGRAGDFGAPR